MSSLVNKSYTNKYKSKLGNESSMTEAILAAAKKTNMCIRFEEKAAIVSNTLIVDVHDILSSSNTRDLEEKLDIDDKLLHYNDDKPFYMHENEIPPYHKYYNFLLTFSLFFVD